MRLLFATMLCAFFFSGAPVFAQDVLVIQSFRAGPYDEALRGFKATCRSETKTVMVSDRERFDIRETVRDEKPGIILAIGANALKQAIKITDTPIIFLFVLNPEKIARGRENVTGVRMVIPADKYLDVIDKLNLPRLKVGILYDPAHSEIIVKRIMQAAGLRGIEIAAKEVHKAKDVPVVLQKMKGSFNLFWMLPDQSVVTPVTLDYLLLFSEQAGTPIVTFAEKYLEMGAMISLEIDSFDLGRQGGEIANRILAGGRMTEIPYAEPRKAVLKVNRKIAAKLGVSLKSLGSSVHAEMGLQNR